MFMDETRVLMKYRLPLAEVVTDFYDELKSRTSGYATFDYEENGYEMSDLVKVRHAYHYCVVRLTVSFPKNFNANAVNLSR
jgi:translation elongation factor EF-4